MYVEIAKIDIDGWRGEVHSFDGVTAFHHEREAPANDWTAAIYLQTETGEEKIVGDGYGLEVVVVEE
jgi:hypothetical protein